jgi:hypothetical protein
MQSRHPATMPLTIPAAFLSLLAGMFGLRGNVVGIFCGSILAIVIPAMVIQRHRRLRLSKGAG